MAPPSQPSSAPQALLCSAPCLPHHSFSCLLHLNGILKLSSEEGRERDKEMCCRSQLSSLGLGQWGAGVKLSQLLLQAGSLGKVVLCPGRLSLEVSAHQLCGAMQPTLLALPPGLQPQGRASKAEVWEGTVCLSPAIVEVVWSAQQEEDTRGGCQEVLSPAELSAVPAVP